MDEDYYCCYCCFIVIVIGIIVASVGAIYTFAIQSLQTASPLGVNYLAMRILLIAFTVLTTGNLFTYKKKFTFKFNENSWYILTQTCFSFINGLVWWIKLTLVDTNQDLVGLVLYLNAIEIFYCVINPLDQYQMSVIHNLGCFLWAIDLTMLTNIDILISWGIWVVIWSIFVLTANRDFKWVTQKPGFEFIFSFFYLWTFPIGNKIYAKRAQENLEAIELRSLVNQRTQSKVETDVYFSKIYFKLEKYDHEKKIAKVIPLFAGMKVNLQNYTPDSKEERNRFLNLLQTYLDYFVQQKQSTQIADLIDIFLAIRTFPPSSPEDAMEILPLLQKNLNLAEQHKMYNLALNYVNRCIDFFTYLQRQFTELKLTGLLPNIKTELEIHETRKLKIEQSIWTVEFNQLATEIGMLLERNASLELNVKISTIITMLNTRIQWPEKTENSTEKGQVQALLEKYTMMLLVNQNIYEFTQFSEQYQQLSISVLQSPNTMESNEHSTAIKQILKLKKDLTKKLKSPDLARLDSVKEVKINDRSIKESYQLLITKCEQLMVEKNDNDILFTYTSLEQTYNDILQRLSAHRLTDLFIQKDTLILKIQTFQNQLEELKEHSTFKEDLIPNLSIMANRLQALDQEIQFHEKLIQYQLYEDTYNTLITSLKESNLTVSLQDAKSLQTNVERLETALHASNLSVDKQVILQSPITRLLDNIAKLQKYIELKFMKLLKNQKQPELERSTIKIPIQLQNVPLKPIQIKSLANISTSQLKQNQSSNRNQNPTTTVLPKISLGSLLDIPSIPLISLKSPLHAKIILLGDSSVGKTHLILSMTDAEYSPTQGSTIGIDKFYKSVSLPITDFDTRLCFWDLGGQWNYRILNELFLHDAAMILLVFDVTRAETFASLTNWFELIKTVRRYSPERIFLVGNKSDVGGNVIPKTDLDQLLHTYQISHYFETSARTKEGILTLTESIIGGIDWIGMIQTFNPNILSQVDSCLHRYQKTEKIWPVDSLVRKLQESIPNADPLELRAILDSYASQDRIILSPNKQTVILDPEFSSKFLAKLIRIASQNHGHVSKEKLVHEWALNPDQLPLFIMYLLDANTCFQRDASTWYFPSVIKEKVPEFDEWTKNILDTNPIVQNYQFQGPGYHIFTELGMVLSRELSRPEFFSETIGLWRIGKKMHLTVAFLQFLPSNTGGCIRIKLGGSECNTVQQQIHDLLAQIFQTNHAILKENL